MRAPCSIKYGLFHFALLLTLTVLSLPALADGFSKANVLLQKISAGLTGLAIITITIATIWVGYKVLWDGNSLKDCKAIIIGGILIASAAEVSALLMG